MCYISYDRKQAGYYMFRPVQWPSSGYYIPLKYPQRNVVTWRWSLDRPKHVVTSLFSIIANRTHYLCLDYCLHHYTIYDRYCFWAVPPYNLVDRYQRSSPHLHGKRVRVCCYRQPHRQLKDANTSDAREVTAK